MRMLEQKHRDWRSAARSAAAVFFFLIFRGCRGSVVRQPILELGLDFRQLFGLGLEVARMGPLEFRLQRTAGAPIGVAEMVVNGGILWLEIDGALEIFHRILVVADAVIGPAKRVSIVGLFRPSFDA